MVTRGFTLIELLVVISIIALLVGILLPALGKARLAAQGTADLSNERQIGIAVFTYLTDNNEYLPVASRHGYSFHWEFFLSPGPPNNTQRGNYVSNEVFENPHGMGPGGTPANYGVTTPGGKIHDQTLGPPYFPADTSADNATLSAYGWNILDNGSGGYGFKSAGSKKVNCVNASILIDDNIQLPAGAVTNNEAILIYTTAQHWKFNNVSSETGSTNNRPDYAGDPFLPKFWDGPTYAEATTTAAKNGSAVAAYVNGTGYNALWLEGSAHFIVHGESEPDDWIAWRDQ